MNGRGGGTCPIALRKELIRQLNAPHHEQRRPVVGGPYLSTEQCLAVVLCLAELLAADAIHATSPCPDQMPSTSVSDATVHNIKKLKAFLIFVCSTIVYS